MANKTAARGARPNARMHNPGEFPLAPPAGRKTNMAAASTKEVVENGRGHGTGSKSSGRTGSKSSGRTGSKGRSTARRHNNPSIKGILGGLRLKSLIAAGGGAVLVQAVSNAFPLGTPGSPLRIGEQLALALLVNKVWPRALDREAATIGAATPAVVALVNRVMPNLQDQITALLPKWNPAAAPGTAGLQVYNVHPPQQLYR